MTSRSAVLGNMTAQPMRAATESWNMSCRVCPRPQGESSNVFPLIRNPCLCVRCAGPAAAWARDLSRSRHQPATAWEGFKVWGSAHFTCSEAWRYTAVGCQVFLPTQAANHLPVHSYGEMNQLNCRLSLRLPRMTI